MNHWFNHAKAVSFPNDLEKANLLKKIELDKMQSEIEWLEEAVSKVDSAIVFCHNDLQEGNIMFDDAKQTIRFIDFEYGSYNYRGFDIANHFCEWTFDYQGEPNFPYFKHEPRFFPSKAQQQVFFRNYLSVWNPPLSTSKLEQEVLKLFKEVQLFTLASHLLWSLWGIIQSAQSDIEFGFLEYAQLRFKEYNTLKDKLNLKENF
jgi:choline/ethanolamine kinase